MRRWIVLLLVLAACGGTGAEAPSSGSSSSPESSSVTIGTLVVPRQLADLDLVTLEVDGRPLLLAVADDTLERSTGLMFISDLDDLDGMVFVYRSDTTTPFHMENTLIPLDIAFFTADGTFVSKTTMTPCLTDDCPNYEAEDRYRYAVEVPAGGFDALDASSRLDVTPLEG